MHPNEGLAVGFKCTSRVLRVYYFLLQRLGLYSQECNCEQQRKIKIKVMIQVASMTCSQRETHTHTYIIEGAIPLFSPIFPCLKACLA